MKHGVKIKQLFPKYSRILIHAPKICECDEYSLYQTFYIDRMRVSDFLSRDSSPSPQREHMRMQHYFAMWDVHCTTLVQFIGFN
jgi:hypothetical protein